MLYGLANHGLIQSNINCKSLTKFSSKQRLISMHITVIADMKQLVGLRMKHFLFLRQQRECQVYRVKIMNTEIQYQTGRSM